MMTTHFGPGRVRFRKLADLATDRATLIVELLDDAGQVAGELELVADDITEPDDRKSIASFALWVEEALRKAQYLREYEEHGNLERVRGAIREDFDAHFFRERRNRGHYEGLGDEALRHWQMQR